MAGWYRTGTVSLTQGSAVVVGAGATLWASALRAGMVFTTDFTTLYEVTAVTDDTHLTLDRPWTGSDVSGAAYAVIYGGAAISNAEIVAELMTMVGKWQTREDQYDDWLAGEPDGGPNGDGRYPLTDSKGSTRLVTSPGRLLWLIDEGLLNNVQQVVDAIRDDIADAQRAADVAASAAVTLTAYVTSADSDRRAAEAARDAARAAETAAGLSAAAAATAAGTIGTSAATAVGAAGTAVGARDAAVIAHMAAEGARNTALSARDTAVQARDSSLQARDVSTQARDQAVASQTAAGVSQARAQEAMSTAVNAAADSVDAKIHAVAAQVVAEQRRNEASGFADSAKAWAINPVGLPVVSGGFSALHWADLARGYAQQAQVIAGGYMFGAVGDGAASRISAQAAADVLHLVQGAGMIITFDQATRKVTFSSIARAVASEDPALTVRLDEAAALAYLGIDRSKLDHGTLVNVGTHGHAEIDAHLDNATIHVPAPGSGDMDKLLKATGAGTFAWVKGTGSGIDADKLDGLSWEEGIEVAGNNSVADWVKLGSWVATTAGRRLLIQATGCGGFANNAAAERGGVTLVSATIGNNNSTTVANIQGSLVYFDNPLLTAVKFKQGANRYTYDVFVQRAAYAVFNYRVSTNGTWTHSALGGQADPGADSATVRAAANLGRMLTTTDLSTGSTASAVAQRNADGTLTATGYTATATAPAYHWHESDQGADLKRWRAYAEGSILRFDAAKDDLSASAAWLEVERSISSPTKATFKVPVHTSFGALGTTAGTEQVHSQLAAATPNSDVVRSKLTRQSAGTNWESSAWRIQRTVDTSDMGFVQFGKGVVADYSSGIGLGSGSTVRVWVPGATGDVTIDGNKAWHSGNFDPTTKAGTAVATMATNGLMPAADKAVINNATASATAGALVRRDDNGAAQFTDLRIGGNTVLTTANGAQLSASNVFTGNVTVSNTQPQINLTETDGGTDSKRWLFEARDGTTLRGLLVNDAGSVFNPWLAVTRSGTTSSAIALTSTAFTHNGNTVYTAGNLAGAWLGQDVRASASPTFRNLNLGGGIASALNFSEGDDTTTWALLQDGGAVGLRRDGVWPAALEISKTDAVSIKESLTVKGSRVADTAYNANNPFRNLFHNPRMRIAQRGIGTSLTAGKQTTDRWSVNWANVNQLQQRLVTNQNDYGSNWLEMQVVAVTPSIPFNGFAIISQAVEVLDTSFLNWGMASAKPVTISFKYQSSMSGTFSAYIRNDVWFNQANSAVTNNRSYVQTFNVVAGEGMITLTFPAPTTGGGATWNRTGMNVGFDFGICLASGNDSGLLGTTANAWLNTGAIAVAGQTNMLATQGAYFRITDTTCEVGNFATPVQAMDRPLNEELRLCQRFYQRFTVDTNAYVYSGYGHIGSRTLLMPMRAIPTVTIASQAADNVASYAMYGDENAIRWSMNPVTPNAYLRHLFIAFCNAEI